MTIDPQEERARKAQARVGGVLRDKWRLDALLGVGGMASVFSATHENNGKRVAVKMLHPELSNVSQVKARFLREGYASNHVGHPGVVSVLDDDSSEDGSVFLVMELLEGENLEQRRAAAGGKLDLLEVLWIADQLLDVLAAAHGVSIVHRDIKPENLFLTRQGALKVLDFGLARVRQPKSRGDLTRTNMLMGTLDFMPPEQALGNWNSVDARSDLWSVGATMFMLLTGHPVHEEMSVDEQIKAITSRPPRSISALRPDLPPPVITIIDRALSFRPEARWPDAVAMQVAVREAYIRVGGGDWMPTAIKASPIEISDEPTVARAPHLDDHKSGSDLKETSAWTAAPSPQPLAPSPHPLAPSPEIPERGKGGGPSGGADGGPPPGVLSVPVAPSPSKLSAGQRRLALLALGSLPVWLLLFWLLSSLGSPKETAEPAPSASAPASAPVAAASSAPEPVAEPPPSASASAKKPPGKPPRKRK